MYKVILNNFSFNLAINETNITFSNLISKSTSHLINNIYIYEHILIILDKEIFILNYFESHTTTIHPSMQKLKN